MMQFYCYPTLKLPFLQSDIEVEFVNHVWPWFWTMQMFRHLGFFADDLGVKLKRFCD